MTAKCNVCDGKGIVAGHKCIFCGGRGSYRTSEEYEDLPCGEIIEFDVRLYIVVFRTLRGYIRFLMIGVMILYSEGSLYQRSQISRCS